MRNAFCLIRLLSGQATARKHKRENQLKWNIQTMHVEHEWALVHTLNVTHKTVATFQFK